MEKQPIKFITEKELQERKGALTDYAFLVGVKDDINQEIDTYKTSDESDISLKEQAIPTNRVEQTLEQTLEQLYQEQKLPMEIVNYDIEYYNTVYQQGERLTCEYNGKKYVRMVGNEKLLEDPTSQEENIVPIWFDIEYVSLPVRTPKKTR